MAYSAAFGLSRCPGTGILLGNCDGTHGAREKKDRKQRAGRERETSCHLASTGRLKDRVARYINRVAFPFDNQQQSSPIRSTSPGKGGIDGMIAHARGANILEKWL